jgi:hypothetical protein
VEIVVGTAPAVVQTAEIATLDVELRRRDHDSPASQRLREALDRGDEQLALRDDELGELALALHGLAETGGLAGSLAGLQETVSGYFAGLEHGS